MKKQIVSSTLLLASLIGAAAPAFAGDDPATNTVLIPVRLVAFGVGAVIGTPVAVVKHVVKDIGAHDEAMADKVGGKDNAAARILLAPFAVVSGTVMGAGQGLYDGPKNSVDNCVEHPFSPASISIGEAE